LWALPKAADFSADPVLSSTDLILAELGAQGALADLAARTAARRAATKGAGGPPRAGCWEALYLAYVDLGFTSITRFHSKLTVGLLRRCCFDFWPSLQLIYERFKELEGDWEAFRAVKNVFVRAAVSAEPAALPGPVMVDATLIRSRYRLERVESRDGTGVQ
jgi:hypothetical protein